MKLPSVKGFHDVLPGESARWAAMEQAARETFARYGFGEIRLPVVERTELFRRSIGETTDIVEKEMYTFEDRDGTSLTLRPEGTASVARAYVEHAMHAGEPVTKLFYFGPMFRRERPQKGRLRQFWQIGAELIGRDDPAADAETLLLLHDLMAAFGIERFEVGLNTLGCGICRPAYREALVAWGAGEGERLCPDCRRRAGANPLRLLDCKQPGCVALRSGAPRVIDHACEACRAHFGRVRELLAAEAIEPALQPFMVRGLDYYCRTAFEITAPGLGAQNAIGGGGRYDGLVRDLGGPEVGGVGFALGVERMAMVLAEGGESTGAQVEFTIAPLGAAAELAAFSLAHRLRQDGARVEVEAAGRSLKSQMRHAGKLGAEHVIILGEDEMTSGRLTLRDMRRRLDHPRAVPLGVSLAELREALANRRAETMERHP
jgi:histidyl-tRNA synthetase